MRQEDFMFKPFFGLQSETKAHTTQREHLSTYLNMLISILSGGFAIVINVKQTDNQHNED